MLQRNNEKLWSIYKTMWLQKSDFEVLHDEVKHGYEILLSECFVSSILEADG